MSKALYYEEELPLDAEPMNGKSLAVILQVSESLLFTKSTNTDDEPCYLVDSDTGTMYFNCRWYDLPAIRKLLEEIKMKDYVTRVVDYDQYKRFCEASSGIGHVVEYLTSDVMQYSTQFKVSVFEEDEDKFNDLVVALNL